MQTLTEAAPSMRGAEPATVCIAASAPTDPEPAAFFAWLAGAGGGHCRLVKDLGDGRYAAAKPLLFHWTLVIGQIGDRFCYDDRYCYATADQAIRALTEWDGNGEPTDWHRHPHTGRRRPDGDAAREYIAW